MKRLIGLLLAVTILLSLLSFSSNADSLGDVNQDNKIDAKDALIALKISVNKYLPSSEELIAADLNKDNRVDAKDALTMLKISVGKDDINNYIDNDSPQPEDPNKIDIYLPVGGKIDKAAFDTVGDWIMRNGSYVSKNSQYEYASGNYKAVYSPSTDRIFLDYTSMELLNSGTKFGEDMQIFSIEIRPDSDAIWYNASRMYRDPASGSYDGYSYDFIYSLPKQSWTGKYAGSMGKEQTVHHAVNIWENTANWFSNVLYRNGVGVSLVDLGIGFENQKVNPDDIVLEKK